MREIEPEIIGYSLFKGIPEDLTMFGLNKLNDVFTKNVKYPVYSIGEGNFVIGSDKVEYKLTPPKYWGKIK